MIPSPMRARLARRFALPLSALLVASMTLARESDPLHLILSQSISTDDNIFRQSRNAGTSSDDISNTSLRAVFDTTQGRQQFHGELAKNKTSYAKLNRLNSDTSSYQLGWVGTLFTKLKMDAGLSRNQGLSSFSDLTNKTRNIYTNDTRNLRLGYSLNPEWDVSVSGTHGTNVNSAAANAVSDVTTDTAETRLQYVSRKGSVAGITFRNTKGEYPNRQQPSPGVFVDNSYLQRDIEGNVSWAPGARSSLTYRLARTRREQKELSQRDFSGNTSNLDFSWQLNGITTFTLSAGRNLSAEDSLLSSYAVVNTRGIGVNWTPTAKISASARIDEQSRVFGGDPGFVLTGIGTPPDKTISTSVSVQYALSRRIQFSAQLRQENRKSPNSLLRYNANTSLVSAQLNF